MTNFHQHASVSGVRPRPVVFRNMLWCSLWSALLLVGLAVVAIGPALIGVLVAAYALQALLADWFGVKVGDDHVSAPQRIAGFFPALVLWRTSAPLTALDSIRSSSAGFAGERVLLCWTERPQTMVLFTDRDTRLSFFRAVREREPNIPIYRSGNRA